MKLNLKFLIVIFSITQITFAQEVISTLTKIERNTNQGQITSYFDEELAPFYHGVASGDPLEDAVIIWTRVTTNSPSVTVQWKIATDQAMSQIVNQGEVITDQSKDYTVKVDAKGLSAYQTYYYQFEAVGVKSIIGKTRTTPKKQQMVDNLRFAVVSCSNYQGGYFNAYNQIAKRNDLDAVIHLGDYIYEYESGGYGYSDDLGRIHLPANEIVTLNDYRVRYSFYRLDPMLRNVHQQHPFINIWDDHEFANDANKFGAENHDPNTEGSWITRKANAHKAYFEWMPIRANSIEEYRLYRKISYGKLMDLMMLDTRIEGRETQVSSSKNLISAAATNKEFKKFTQEVIATKDLTQKEDVAEILEVVLPMILNVNVTDKEIDNALNQEELDRVISIFTERIIDQNFELTNKKQTDELTLLLEKGTRYEDEKNAEKSNQTYKSILGAEQFEWLTNELRTSQARWKVIGNQVMVMPWKGVPSDDAWDGYSEERNRLLRYIKDNDINNLIVLTGDIHSTFIGEVKYDGKCEMCEFVVPSVTSTNLDFLGGLISGVGEFYVKLLNSHFKDVDLNNHGYYVLDVREDRVQGDWYDTNEIKRPVNGETHSRSWYVNNNDCRVRKTSNPSSALKGVYEKSINNEFVNQEKIKDDNFTVIGVYPNPLEVNGNVHYLVNKNSEITVALFDINGTLIKTLQNDRLEKGIYNLSFTVDGIQPGTYIITMTSDNTKATRKIVIR